MASNSKLVYSTDSGRIKEDKPQQAAPTGDGIVRIKRETKGRKGKGVTLVEGLMLPEAELKALSKKLKQLCGTGGTLKNFTVEIQGDHREKLQTYLKEQGFTVKLAGG
ncbi:stress response translation initiation inhibitor YciH [Saccharophagus degradans]|uniref:Translation initiation factor 1 (EIF-1/SUI1) n=1 Tax=Saccharophagus degradans (strain 2-40 / ATCC 43961 / DSM 17024) TaxID=203122 RepID=Q21HI9_SACD2|nr:stress response translation initiation inhibitor YciH [Saccharophagus degradans]ABD81840.1 translation initiation factor 1 (eIF-1/SUI1) [Saccharophagus degradans 2-40]